MKIKVNKNYVTFDVNTKVNKREFKATPLEFEFSEDYEGLTCKAVFSVIPKDKEEVITFYQQPIIDGKCFIPYEVMEGEGILIGVYGYLVDGEELVLRYSPEPKNLWFLEGSFYDGAETPEEILPSQFEQYTSYLNSQIEKLDRMKIETEEISNGVKIIVTNSDGETTETEIYNGQKGEKGDQGEPGVPGTTNYNELTDKPSINGTTLEGDVSLEDIGIGNVFNIKGSVSTPQDLPLTGNSIGDVYYVESVMAGFVWIEVNNIERWEELGEPIDLSAYQEKMQFATLPTPSAGNLGEIVQYIGQTTNELVNGYFYQVVSDGEATPSYSWENVLVQQTGGSGECPVYVWNGEAWSSSTPTTNSDVKETWDKVIDCLLNNKPFFFSLIISKEISSVVRKLQFIMYVTYRQSNNKIEVSCINNPSFSRVYSFSFTINNALDSNNKITNVPSVINRTLSNYEYLLLYPGYPSGGLSVTNTSYYAPTSGSYNPATAKYVDDSISSAIGSINTILATLTTPSNGGGN